MESVNIKIDNVKGNESEYVIRDESKITIGRFIILEFSKENRAATIRLKFYRVSDSNLLEQSLHIICRTIFKNSPILKLNLMVPEDLDTRSFLNIGFVLEGIITNNLYSNGNYKSELSFGITEDEYAIHKKYYNVDLKGRRISVRSLGPDDAQSMLDFYARNKDHLAPYEPRRDESFYTLKTQTEILKESYTELINGTGITLGIFKNDSLIGRIKISDIVYGIFKSCYLGYCMAKDHQGNGYMKEAVNLVLEYIKNDLELHRVEASTLVDNVKSQSVLKSCGFEELGLNKKYLYINGDWRDHITFYKII